MIFLGELNIINTEDAIPSLIHEQPFHDIYGFKQTQDELNKIGILVESLPTKETYIGKTSELHVNPKTKEVWYEYTDIPKNNDEITKDTIDNLQKDNALLLKENAKKDAMIESLNKDVADIYKVIGGNK